MDDNTVLVFPHYGMGDAPAERQQRLPVEFLALIEDASLLPAKILFYTGGAKLACEGSRVLEQLRPVQARGVELILCQTCLDYFGLLEQVAVRIVGGMPDIIEATQKAQYGTACAPSFSNTEPSPEE